MRKLITLGLLFSLLTLASLSAPTTVRTSAQVNTELQYAAKFVCGKTGAGVVATGYYYTAINVHNPSPNKTVDFRKKFAIALPDEKAGKITQFIKATLRADEAMGIDCPNIYKHTGIPPGTFLEGYVVIHTPMELDVVTIYTAGVPNVETLHTERVPPRRVPIVTSACGDLNLTLNTGIANWQVKSDPDSTTPEPRAASIISSPHSLWASLPPAKWIGPKTTSGGDGIAGNYEYQFCFCLCPGFTNAKLSLTGMADDSATVSFGGQSLGSLGGFSGPPQTVQTSDQQLFKPGKNCVTVAVYNAGGPTGFIMTGAVTATGGLCPTGPADETGDQ